LPPNRDENCIQGHKYAFLFEGDFTVASQAVKDLFFSKKGFLWHMLAYWFHIGSPFIRKFFGSSSGILPDFWLNPRRTPEGIW
jgi:hypothetical protein